MPFTAIAERHERFSLGIASNLAPGAGPVLSASSARHCPPGRIMEGCADSDMFSKMTDDTIVPHKNTIVDDE